jgi:hypothetical protein
MHDGVPLHFSLVLRAFLNDRFPRQWIGRGGPTEWPARSPDLNPLDFYMWGHLKSVVYTTPANDVMELQQKVVAACEDIRRRNGVFERVRGSMMRRAAVCVTVQGGHFQHL